MHLGKYRFWRLLAALFAATLILGACGGDDDEGDAADTTDDAGDDAAGEGVTCEEGISLGFFGALTGPNANLGINERNGIKVALEEFNEENPDCEVGLEEFDSQGTP